MRALVFLVAVVFIAGMIILTALDFANNGVTALGVVSVIVVIVVGVGVLGALTEPPKKK